jgi:hypothetical protein
VLFLGTTSVGLEALNKARFAANHQRGGFEVDKLVAFALLPGKLHAKMFACAVKSLATSLDQHGLLSCFYTALRYYGPDEAMAAFAEEFRDNPWWALPWEDEPHNSELRVCRDVRAIVPNEARQIVDANPAWAPHWSNLDQRLKIAQTPGTPPT